MKLIIFDCDGTLVDSQIGIVAAMQHAFTELGLPPPSRERVLSVVGLSLPETFTVLAGDQPSDLQHELARIYKSDFLYAKTRSLCTEPLFDGAKEIIESLAGRPDVVLGMATGKSQRGVRRILDREGWHGIFATIQTADENPSKPNPGMIAAAMRATGMGEAQTVMVGDTTYDIEMAVNAGVGGVGVAWGYHAPELLTRAGAHTIADHCSAVPAIVDAMFHVKQILGDEA